MSELAFDLHGDPFVPDPRAIGWRVRRMKPKGTPEVVYGANGTPLILGIGAEIDDLKSAVGAAGRYRLDQVDDDSKPIKDAVPAYVHVDQTTPTASAPRGVVSNDAIVIEAMRMNMDLARSVVERFPQMMDSAANLLRAADGAGLPARPGMATEGDDDDDDEEDRSPTSGFDLNALIAQLVPVLMMSFASGGKGKMPGLAEMMDWRRAAAKAKPSTSTANDATDKSNDATSSRSAADKGGTATKSKADAEPKAEPSATTTPLLDPETMAHFLAVRSMLSPEESALASKIARELTPAELRVWFDELRPLSVADAVERVRKLIGTFDKKGGAS